MLVVFGVASVIITISALGWATFSLYRDNKDLKVQLSETNEQLGSLKQGIVSNPGETIARLQSESTESILDEVRKLYAIPEDETPTIATVQDIEKLRDQPFFDGAQNGDILIVFESSSQAILYRSSERRLVRVGPISVDDTQSDARNGQSNASPDSRD